MKHPHCTNYRKYNEYNLLYKTKSIAYIFFLSNVFQLLLILHVISRCF